MTDISKIKPFIKHYIQYRIKLKKKKINEYCARMLLETLT